MTSTDVKVWSPELLQRFFNKVIADGECLVWTGCLSRDGYGKCIDITYGNGYAHRALYFQLYGYTDLVIDHLCRNRACVNPDHLEAVTQKVNVHRGLVTKFTRTHCANGHEWNSENARVTPRGWGECLLCIRSQARLRMRKKRAVTI